VDFSPRRVYTAVQDKALQLAEAGPGYYEETNPAIRVAAGTWVSTIDPLASGQAALVGEAPGSTLTFAFRGGQVYLVAQRSAQGGQLLVTLDGETVEGLPRDERGRSYIELYAPQGSQEEGVHSFLLVKDSSPRRRTLRLAVSEFTHPDSMGHVSVVDAFRVGKAASAPFPVFPVILLLIGCVTVGWMLGRSTIANGRRRRR
jgi:hypothetical protein